MSGLGSSGSVDRFFGLGEKVRATYEGKRFTGEVASYNLDDPTGKLGVWVRHPQRGLLIFYLTRELQKLR